LIPPGAHGGKLRQEVTDLKAYLSQAECCSLLFVGIANPKKTQTKTNKGSIIMVSKFTPSDTDIILEKLRERLDQDYPLGTPRTCIMRATGGILNPKTLASRDSEGNGISGVFYVGRKAVYPNASIIEYLRPRMTQTKADQVKSPFDRV